MKEKYSSCEIEFCCENGASREGKNRKLYWRIKPDQLNWFQRLFTNQWRQLSHECMGSWNPYFSSTEFLDKVKPCRTVADIERYVEEEAKLIENYPRETFGWPKNLNE
jgi:hypothetical protein